LCFRWKKKGGHPAWLARLATPKAQEDRFQLMVDPHFQVMLVKQQQTIPKFTIIRWGYNPSRYMGGFMWFIIDVLTL
jgi:hypothetical protein